MSPSWAENDTVELPLDLATATPLTIQVQGKQGEEERVIASALVDVRDWVPAWAGEVAWLGQCRWPADLTGSCW
jgi:hypothetical protein